MSPTTGCDSNADLRLARLVADLRLRLALLRDVAWDVNLVALSAHDATMLADIGLAEGHAEASDHLYALVGKLSSLLHGSPAPDDDGRTALAWLFENAAALLPALEEPLPPTRTALTWLVQSAAALLPALEEPLPPAEPDFDFEASGARGIAGDFAEYDGFDTDSALTISELSIIPDVAPSIAGDPSPVRVVDLAKPATLPRAPGRSLAADGREAGSLIAAPPPTAAIAPAAMLQPTPVGMRATAITPSVRAKEWLAPPASRPASATTTRELAPGEQRTAYLLAGDSAYAAALEAALAAAGLEIHRFDDPAELAETVGALVPAAVLIAPDSFDGLGTVASAVASARKRANAPILLVTIAADGGIPTRLAAMRAGADAFLVEPADPALVVARLGELDAASAAEPFRVMIVEDDRPQAAFAESILRKAGMQTRAVHDPLEAIDALEAFDPELILMDLLMPGCDGIELTTLIRERDRFANVPVVFLSGEHSAERRFDALAVGGDDFLEKPIKPKFLLSAVGNRVRRARSVRQQGSNSRQGERSVALNDRTRLVERTGEALAGANATTPGGLLFLIVDGAQTLREKLGLMAFDLAMQQAGAMLAESLAAGVLAARFGDSSFIVLAPQSDREALAELASRLARAFAERLIQSESGSLALAASIGIASFNQGWRDAAALVNAAERAAARARSAAGERIVTSPGPDTADATDADAALRNAVVTSLAAGGLQLLYQPIAALHGGGDEIFQVLLRLRDQRGRRYSAAEIVPMAERNGLIDQVDRAVLAKCVEVLGQQRARGRPTALIISQSIHGIADPGRIDWLKHAARSASVNPEQFVLEFRHEDVAPRLAESAAWIEVAKAAGFRTAIGTFEPNPAAVQSLQRLPVDLLRVSGRFVAQIDAARARVLGELASAAHAQGVRVIVPMVEDARTAAALWGTGVDFIQGDFVQGAGSDLEFDFRAAAF